MTPWLSCGDTVDPLRRRCQRATRGAADHAPSCGAAAVDRIPGIPTGIDTFCGHRARARDDAYPQTGEDRALMEPSAIESKPVGRAGSLTNPEVIDVPGHIIPILEREFDDFDNEAAQVPRRPDRGDRVHRLPPQAGRVRPAPGRRPDVPREAAVRRHQPRADGCLRVASSRSTRRSTRATSRRGRTSRSITSRWRRWPS